MKEKKTGKDADDEDESEIFKMILKEDWIPEAIKDTLKTLKDFLNYLLKSLKTVKSKIFYEKVCAYVNMLFKLVKILIFCVFKQVYFELIYNFLVSSN